MGDKHCSRDSEVEGAEREMVPAIFSPTQDSPCRIMCGYMFMCKPFNAVIYICLYVFFFYCFLSLI